MTNCYLISSTSFLGTKYYEAEEVADGITHVWDCTGSSGGYYEENGVYYMNFVTGTGYVE